MGRSKRVRKPTAKAAALNEREQPMSEPESDVEPEPKRRKVAVIKKPNGAKVAVGRKIAQTIDYSHPPIDDEFKWETVMKLGTPLWPKFAAGNKRVQAIAFDALMSLPAMRHAKWYKDINVDADTTPAQMLILAKELEIHADTLADILDPSKSYMQNGTKDLIVWMKFCIERYDGDFAVDDILKVHDFIPYRVANAIENARRSKKYNGEKATASTAAHLAQSRIGHLANIQGYFTIKEITNSRAISSLTAKYRAELVASRLEPQCFASTSRVVTKNMTPKEETRVRQIHWEDACDFPSMRAYLLYMLNVNNGHRGHELRELYMGALLHRVCSYVKPVTCNTLIGSVRHIKNAHNNLEHIITWTRTPDPEDCGIGALANYMVYIVNIAKNTPLFDQMEEDLLSHIAWADEGKIGDAPKSKWWSMRLAFASDPYAEISYDTHAAPFKKYLKKVGIRGKTAVLHLLRHIAVKKGLEKGEATADLASYMRWFTKAISSAMDSYKATATIVSTMLLQHNWDDMKHYECWREGNEEEIPTELLDMVFPRLNMMKELAENAYEATEIDLSAIEFLDVLTYLAKVFLEDSIIMRERYPKFPAFMHPLFQTPLYETWAAAEKGRVQQREDEYFFTKKDPDMMNVIQCMQRENLKTRMLMEKMALKITGETPPQPAAAPPPIAPADAPKSIDPVPRIPKVVSIKQVWYEWDKVLRPYFSTHGKPAYKNTYPDDEKEVKRQKTAMYRIQSIFLYMDDLIQEHGFSADDILRRFHIVRTELGNVTEPAFVTETMCNFIQLSTKVPPTGVAEALTRAGLPLPTMTAAQYRKKMWGRGKKK